MQAGRTLTLVLMLLIVFFLYMSVFVVDETQRAIVMRLGQFQADKEGAPKILEPGMHFKVPFIDTVRYFDKRIQTIQIDASRIPTEEKKELFINIFTKWRIKDFALFFRSTAGYSRNAEKLLQQKTIDGLRAEIGRRNLNDVVSTDRDLIMTKISQDVNEAAKNIGIEVIDARMIRIDLPDEVSDAVFGLMRTERNRIAAEHRAKGRSRAEAIKAKADAKVTVIVATADQESRTIRGEGDAEAAKIYEKSYSKDPEFFRFYRSLEAYKNTFQAGNDMLVIKPDSDFFKYFQTIEGNK